VELGLLVLVLELLLVLVVVVALEVAMDENAGIDPTVAKAGMARDSEGESNLDHAESPQRASSAVRRRQESHSSSSRAN
jgi:hypothetical protein